jgi:hypothetical protein
MHATAFTSFPRTRWSATLALAFGLIGAGLRADPKDTDAFPTYDSYIKVSGLAPSVTGNGASYAQRAQTPDWGSYGIEDMHLSKDLDDATNMIINGRALVGAEDYLGQIKLVRTDVGTVDVGYKRFRTFYDGIGGFFPQNSAWMPLSPEDLHTDRANFWAETTIALPNQPVFRLRYTNELRSGQKDSTVWGDTDLTGIPIYNVSSLNPVSANKKIVPALLDMNERQQNLSATLTHTVGNTELEFEIAKNWTNSDDTRWMNRYPGELKAYPPYSTSPPPFLIDPTMANNFITGYDEQLSDTNTWSYFGKFTTKVSDKFTVYGGLGYRDASADIAGNRQMSLAVQTATGVVSAVGGFVGSSGRPTYSYQTVSGSTSERILTGNLGVTYLPKPDFTVGLALKAEKLDMDGNNLVMYNSNMIDQATGIVTPINVLAPNTSERTETSWVPELDLRYSAIKNLALYGTFDYRYAPGDEYAVTTGVNNGGTAGTPTISSDNVEVNHGHYKVGANWTATSYLTLRGEVFYKDHVNEFTGYGASTGSGYILGYKFHGYKLTAIIKATPTLTFTTRYVGQIGTMDTTVDEGESYQSMDSKSHLFGETVDWNPNKQVYVQLNANIVFATISTAYPQAGGTANDVLRNSDNNYQNGNLLIGFVLNKSTDAQFECTGYRADNYDPLAPPSSVSYGAGVKEYTVTAGIKHKVGDRMFLDAKVGYFDSRNDTTGGNTNFHGPAAYVSIEHAL